MKILVVEDNYTFAKLIKKMFEKNLLFSFTDTVSSFEELKKVDIDRYDLFICDFVLEDSNEGEHITYLLKENKKVIVITSYEKEFLDFPYKDRAIDYVFKEEYRMMDYLIKLVNRLYKNRNLTILLVDDSSLFRKMLKNILEIINLKVIEANNGHEALEILKYQQVDIIISDLEMGIMDGEELVIRIREIYSMHEIPILIVSGQSKDKLIRTLKLGANDFIYKPFIKEEFIIRIHNLIEIYENIRRVEEKLIIDPLTKVYNRFYLENELETLFKFYNQKSVAILDLDFFKRINDTYGHQIGDKVLKEFASTIKKVVRRSDAVIRYGGEEFIVFMPNTNKYEAFRVIQSIKKSLNECCGIKYTFSAGIADEGETLAEMIRIADKRLYKAKEKRDSIVVS